MIHVFYSFEYESQVTIFSGPELCDNSWVILLVFLHTYKENYSTHELVSFFSKVSIWLVNLQTGTQLT